MKISPFLIASLFLALVAAAFVVLPLAALAANSTLSGFVSSISSPAVQLTVYFTMLAGGIAALVSLVVGVPAAYYLAKTPDLLSTRLLGSILELPIMIPHFVVGIALLLFAPFIFQTFEGVVAVMVFVGMGYTIKAAESAFLAIDPSYEKIAWTLGASRTKTFFRVLLPISARASLGGALLTWSRGISEMGAFLVLAYFVYPVPPILGSPTNPMSIYAYQVYQLEGVRGAASVSLVYVAISLIIFLLMKYVQNWREISIAAKPR
ncbi:MAG: ABC transporter permease [Nitrososphaerota archaeon]|nr:ABC transporter permease [Nitrososphaerota archaeon]MDG6923182.1 ABC transporter permease [Nitrososphaerota archaeon]